MPGSDRCRAAVLALVAPACSQALGIENGPVGEVPAISGDYVAAIDFRPNATLNTVIVFRAHVTYQRDAHVAAITLQPLTAGDQLNIGDPFDVSVVAVEAAEATYSGDGLVGDIPSAANTQGVGFAISGTVAGVFQSDQEFCGVITGEFTLGPDTSALPSVTFGALKSDSPSGPVAVNCNGDLFSLP